MDARKSSPGAPTADREIVLTRVFGAPRQKVWEAMVDPQHVAQWWGPRGFTTTIEKMDVRPGGAWKHVMHGPDGTDYPNRSVFKEVVKPERIVYAHGGGRQGGPGAHFTATWTFEALGAKTRVTIRMIFDSPSERDTVVKEYGAIEGGQQTLERLGEFLYQSE
ncbi:MAG: SRPBCC family protein [Sulfuricaulis sp.]